MLLSPTSRLARRGTVAVIAAVCMIALLSCVALSVDGGMLQDRRRGTQAAADAAALAAANKFYWNWTYYKGVDVDGAARAAALATAKENGYDPDTPGTTVTINIPPASGPSMGVKGVAEVIITFDHDRYFSKVFGSDKIEVGARAVARGRTSLVREAILILNPTKKASLNSGGGGTMSVNGGPIQVNSIHPEAGVFNGGGTITLGTDAELDITGNYVTPGGGGVTGEVNTREEPIADPLSYLVPPDPDSLVTQRDRKYTVKKDTTLQPGVYEGGITISNCNVTLAPGIYYMKGGGFSWSGSGTLTGNGVMIYCDPARSSDTISLSGNAGVQCTLSPPTDGPYKGITFWQRRDADSPLNITGNGGMNVSGTFYAASADMKVTGNGVADLIGSQYIVDTLTTGGGGSFSVNWTPDKVPATRIITLIE